MYITTLNGTFDELNTKIKIVFYFMTNNDIQINNIVISLK